MGSGYGLSRAMSGVTEGVRQVEATRDRATNRERSNTLWEQGQQDRTHQLGRQQVTEGREDDQYALKRKVQLQQESIKSGMQALMAGDLETVSKVVKEITGTDVKYAPTKNGGVLATRINPDGTIETKEITTDDIGIRLQGLLDPDAILKQLRGEKMGAQEKASDRQFELSKIDRKGKWDLKVKTAGEGAGGAGDSGIASAMSKEMRARSAQGHKAQLLYFGDDSMADIIEPSKRAQAIAAGEIMDNYIIMGEKSIDTAARLGIEGSSEVAKEAMDQLKAEGLDPGDGGEGEDRLKQLIMHFGGEYAKAKSSEAALSREPESGGKGAGEGTAKTASKPTWEQYLASAEKRRPPGMDDKTFMDAVKNRYNEKFGGGAESKTPKPEKPKAGTDKESDRERYGEPISSGNTPEAPQKGKANTAGISGGNNALNRGDSEINPEPGKPKYDATLSRKKQKTQTQGDFLRHHKEMESNLSGGNKKYAQSIINKLNDDYKNNLTKAQRDKADALIKKAESILRSK